MYFTIKEQNAILQCLWQLFSASPTKEECEHVENHITQQWDCKVGRDFDLLESIALVHDGVLQQYHTKYSWIVCAIEQDPYESFYIVSNFSTEQKGLFKSVVKSCVENYGDTNYKTAMAVTLFENTDVPYAIRGKDWLFDQHNGNKTII